MRRLALLLAAVRSPTLFLIFFLAPGAGILAAQTLQVTPDHVLVDEPAVVRVTGLQPGQRITLQAELVDGAEHHWNSQADFIADEQGTVDASRQSPVSGSYKEVSAMGLVWSMMPAEKHVPSYRSVRDLGPQIIEFRLVQNGRQVSSARLEQRQLAEGVRRIKIEGKLHGMLFMPDTNERHAGVLVVGGSEGGAPLQRAAWLASHGFAALALAYFRYEDLPPELEAIPLEYFGMALNWMTQRPDILPDEIAVVGGSRGGELALQLGSMYPQIKAVVAFVPANMRFPGCCGGGQIQYAWTWKGAPLSYAPLRFLRDPATVMNAAIAVEQTRGPILLISGQDDGVWQSSMMADAIVARLKQAHFSYRVEHLKYQHAGHWAGHPRIFPAWHGKLRHPVSGREVDLGGTVAGDAHSSLDAAPKVLEFLRQSLQKHNSEQ